MPQRRTPYNVTSEHPGSGRGSRAVFGSSPNITDLAASRREQHAGGVRSPESTAVHACS